MTIIFVKIIYFYKYNQMSSRSYLFFIFNYLLSQVRSMSLTSDKSRQFISSSYYFQYYPCVK